MQFVGGVDERDVGRTCCLKRCRAGDRQFGTAADKRSLHVAGKFFERNGHGILHDCLTATLSAA